MKFKEPLEHVMISLLISSTVKYIYTNSLMLFSAFVGLYTGQTDPFSSLPSYILFVSHRGNLIHIPGGMSPQ